MLEKYVENFSADGFIKSFMEEKQVGKAEATSLIRKSIPKESFYQTKVKEGLKKAFPDAFVVKVSLGNYAEAGIPDLLCIWQGHYFGFEIKRPIFGEASPLQAAIMKKIRAAGGTAEIVSWPEEAIKIMEDYKNGKKA